MVEHLAAQSKAKQDTIEHDLKCLEIAKTTVESSSETLKQFSLQLQSTEKRERESLKKEMEEQKEAHKCHCRKLAKALGALSKLLTIRKEQLSELLKEKDN